MASAPGTLFGSYQQSEAIKAKAEVDRELAQANKEMAEFKAKDAIDRGRDEENRFRKNIKRVIGSQRAALAAQGIELDEGSALAIQEDTAVIGEIDALTIRNNARREAWGYKSQALSMNFQSQIDYATSRSRARSTMLTGLVSTWGQVGGAVAGGGGGGGGGAA